MTNCNYFPSSSWFFNFFLLFSTAISCPHIFLSCLILIKTRRILQFLHMKKVRKRFGKLIIWATLQGQTSLWPAIDTELNIQNWNYFFYFEHMPISNIAWQVEKCFCDDSKTSQEIFIFFRREFSWHSFFRRHSSILSKVAHERYISL